jgi:ribonuclease BN (tRNA processing enzyme)
MKKRLFEITAFPTIGRAFRSRTENTPMKLTLLGTGTPAPSIKRQSSGHIVEIGEEKIILDHGPGAHQRLIEGGFRATEATHALFSHLHYDHCMDYPRLVLQRWDVGAGKIPELMVYGPTPLKRMTETLFGEGGFFEQDVYARTNHQASLDVFEARGGTLPRKPPKPVVTEIRPGDTITGRNWRATVGESSHMQPYLECYGYRIESDRGTICYAGDSGGVCETVIDLARKSDILLHMMHFASGDERSQQFRKSSGSHLDVAEVARQAEVGTLVVTHVTPIIDAPGVRERLIAEMAKIYTGTIVWGEDLMSLSVPHACQSGID